MEFTISRTAFIRLLRTAASAAAKLTTKPILREILLEATPDAVYATGYNGQFGITARQAAEMDVVRANETGKATVDAVLLEVVQQFDGNDVFVQLREQGGGQGIFVTDNQSEFVLPSSDWREYPPLPTFDEVLEGNRISSQTLSGLLRKITPSAADESQTQPGLLGVHFRTGDGGLLLEASNSHLISQGYVSYESVESDFVVPKTSLSVLLKNLPADGQAIEFASDENVFLVKTSRLLFFTALIDAEFPNTSKIWDRISGRADITKTTLGKHAFRSAIQRTMILVKTSENKRITLESKEDQLQIRAKVDAKRSVKEDVRVTEMSGKKRTLSFNADYLSRLTNVIERDQMVLVLGDQVVYFEDEDSRHLLLGVRVG